MIDTVRDWFGFSGSDIGSRHGGHGDDNGNGKGHGHTHGLIDPSIASTEEGIWAIKWSFAILAVTAILQLIVVVISGSVALLADMIHNVGDATTAIPLWFAFMLARRKPSKTFTYGLGRAEDLAGILVVLIILFSAIVAGYEAISRLIHPQPVQQLGWLAAAGIIGFLGNEIVAVFRIRVGRRMNSAALIADGYHARTDGLTSLAVVLGAIGVWFGFPLADPIIGLLITIAIFGIVWQSSQAVVTRMLDGVEPGVTDEIRHSAEHVPGIRKVVDAKARWLGHELHADVTIAVDDQLPLAHANAIAAKLQRELRAHIPALAMTNVRFDGDVVAGIAISHHRAPEPFKVHGRLAEGLLEIIDTADGERMRLTVSKHTDGLRATVVIKRSGGNETLQLLPTNDDHHVYLSPSAPTEPHEFDATLFLRHGVDEEACPFHIAEPDSHHH